MKISRASNVTSTLCKVKKKIVKLGIKTAQKEIMSFLYGMTGYFRGESLGGQDRIVLCTEGQPAGE